MNELLPINSWTYIAEGGPTDRIGGESVCKSHTKSRERECVCERAMHSVKQYNENYLWTNLPWEYGTTVITIFLYSETTTHDRICGESGRKSHTQSRERGFIIFYNLPYIVRMTD